MTNFNEAIKATKSGRISVASYCDIVICKTMKEFQKAVCNYHMNSYFTCSEHPKNEMETVFDYPYMEDNYQSLHIEYKSTHRNAKIAGRSYFWTNDDEDLNGVECGKPYGDDKGFGIPRFDGIESAVYIDDYEIILYNGSVEAELEDELTVRLHIFAGGKEINETMISTEEFDNYFKLDENFLNYDEIFWESEDETTEEEVEVEAEDESKATEAAQIVAETAQESTNEEESTELILTGNERITDKIVPESYWRELFGSVFFDKRKCQEDIEDVKLFINYAIGLLRGVLYRLDETQESVEKNAGLSDDGRHLLRKSKVEMDVVRGMLLEMINNIVNVEWRACKYRCTDANNLDLQ